MKVFTLLYKYILIEEKKSKMCNQKERGKHCMSAHVLELTTT